MKIAMFVLRLVDHVDHNISLVTLGPGHMYSFYGSKQFNLSKVGGLSTFRHFIRTKTSS